MNLNKLKSLYTNSPYLIKKIYSLIPFNIRNGRVYRFWRSELKKENKQNRNLFDVVKYGFNNFKLYKDLYKEIDITKWEKIPLIDKLLVQEYLEDFENFKVSKFYVTTGGVTGKPAKYYQSNNVWYKELAFVYNYFAEFGYKPPNKKASFRGGDFSNLKSGEFWVYNPIYNEIHFSPFHLNRKSIKKYVEKLNKIKPKYFHGYPSVFITLAKLMSAENLKLSYQLNTIFLISEGFKKSDIQFLKEFFNCNISSFYGHSERLIFAVGDRKLESYIPDPSYGYFELIDQKGNVIKKNNVVGEIVGTSFDNFAMPLIRYRTGDFTSYIDFSQKRFGPIAGKWGQMSLTGYENEEITLTALNLHSSELDNILKLQFIQKDKGRVLLYVMFKNNNIEHNLEGIERLLTERVGGRISFQAKVTDKFKLNSRGKAPLIINEITS